MNPVESGPENSPASPATRRRLDSWKEIAAYLNRDIKTCQRWEKREGMIVHRHQHDRQGSVHAYTDELDAWRGSRTQASNGKPTTAESDEPSPESTEAAPPYPPTVDSPGSTLYPAHRFRVFGIVAAVVIALVTMLALWAAQARRETGGAVRAVRFLIHPPPVESFTAVSVSPDGSSVLHSGEHLLHVRRIDSARSTSIQGTEQAYDPFWSADGQHVGFFAGHDLKITNVAGGISRTICQARRAVGATWSPNGTIVFAAELGAALFRVDVASGNPVPIRTVDTSKGQQALRWPHFLPDGRRFLYFTRSYDPRVQGIYLGSIDNPRATDDVRLMAAESNAAFSLGHVLVVQAGVLVATAFDAVSGRLTGEPRRVAEHVEQEPYGDGFAQFSASRDGVLAYKGGRAPNRELRWFDRTGRHIGTVGSADEYRDFELSHDETRVAIVTLDPGSGMQDIWIRDLNRGAMLLLTRHPAHDGAPVWSPDDRRLAYGSTRDGRVAIFETMASGADVERLLFTGPAVPFDWSPDGRHLVLQHFSARTQTDLVLVGTGADEQHRKPVAYLDTTAMEGEPQYSPDGRWMAYSSTNSGARQIFVEPIPRSGARWQISSGQAREPRWRGDGRELFYLGDGNALMSVAMNLAGNDWTVGRPESLFSLRVTDRDVRYHYAVSSDGNRFLVNTVMEDAVGTPINVWMPWTDPATRAAAPPPVDRLLADGTPADR